MTAYGIFAASTLGTPEDKVRAELGEMQAWVAPAGVPGEGFWQAPTQPQWTGYPASADGSWEVPDGAIPDDPIAALPPGTEAILLTSARARIETRDGLGLVAAWTGDAWDPRFSGAFDLVEGERPTSATEAMVTPATLERLGIVIGGDLTLADGAGTFEIVGTLDAAILPDAASAVFLPGTAELRGVIGGERRWYLPEPALSWDDVQALNEEGVVAYSRAVVLDPPTALRKEVRGSVLDQWANVWPTVLVVSAGGPVRRVRGGHARRRRVRGGGAPSAAVARRGRERRGESQRPVADRPPSGHDPRRPRRRDGTDPRRRSGRARRRRHGGRQRHAVLGLPRALAGPRLRSSCSPWWSAPRPLWSRHARSRAPTRSARCEAPAARRSRGWRGRCGDPSCCSSAS